jgi:hypothetical protein
LSEYNGPDERHVDGYDAVFDFDTADRPEEAGD